jgi:3-hydroxyacyl-[acyl-carrier-protein] dehydratase
VEEIVEVEHRRNLTTQIEQRRNELLLGTARGFFQGMLRRGFIRWKCLAHVDLVVLPLGEIPIILRERVASGLVSPALATSRSMDLSLPLDYSAIERILPHRYPFLLVDRVTEFDPDKRIVGIKNVTLNERYLSHQPGGPPVLPPTILTEAVAQVGAIMILAKPENREKLIYFMGIERVRYRRPVHPGDQVVIEAVVRRLRSRMGVLRGIARVDGRVVVEGTMTFALGPRTESTLPVSAQP